ncbi:uncharacterized protein LOC133914175 [Phragmites australis]|uniref:uncharacterized protein LOC133914175 n=1 Tax=Phragmites australis TaxID=29695 RepID=UPI002D776AFD|nr:uncharacterized protein LOC133914175 [Phragmites australis]
MATLHQHHIKALTPTWLLVKATPAPPRDGAKKPAPTADYSPLLLSPSVWQKAQNGKKRKVDGRCAGRAGGLPASPRISCMGQVKGVSRGCSSARGPASRGSGYGGGGGGGKVARLVLGLFGRRSRRTSRACSKVRDVPRGSASASASRSSRGAGAGAAVAVGIFDPPLPVVRRPVTDGNAPSLWERRRGGKALEGLRLT